MKIKFCKISDHDSDNILIMNGIEDKARPNTQSAVGHYYAKRLIADNIKSKVGAVKLNRTKKGKLYFNRANNISISHTGDYVFTAFSDTPVGIDGELLRKINPKFIYKVLGENEIEEKADFDIEFLKAWTLKEAYIKLKGQLKGEYQSYTKQSLSENHTIITNVTEEYIMSAIAVEK